MTPQAYYPHSYTTNPTVTTMNPFCDFSLNQDPEEFLVRAEDGTAQQAISNRISYLSGYHFIPGEVEYHGESVVRVEDSYAVQHRYTLRPMFGDEEITILYRDGYALYAIIDPSGLQSRLFRTFAAAADAYKKRHRERPVVGPGPVSGYDQ